MNTYANQIKYYCISLKENETERIRCSREFEKIGLPFEFEIVERSPLGGAHGCFMSHIDVLKKGLESNSKYIMITEDDVYFEYSHPSIFEKIFKFIESANPNVNWCLCFGYLSGSKLVSVNKDIVALKTCSCSHAYVVPRRTAEELIKMEWNGSDYDVDWHKVINYFYAPYPMIAFQKDHKSSISNDWGKYFLNTFGFKNSARICEFWNRLPF
jgi:hypothetical protein